MTLAIVTSCYRYGQYLPDWADSILALTRKPDLVAIVTHGTADDFDAASMATVRLTSAGLRVIHHHHAELLDFGEARNKAVELAECEWVMHLDADDMLLPHALADVAKLMPKADVVCLGYERCGDLADGPRQKMKLYRTSQGPGALENPTPCSGVSPFRRSFWERSPYRTDLIGGWDTALWLGFAHLGARFVPTSRPCFLYRQHADSLFNERRLSGWPAAKAGAKLQSLRRGDTGVSILVPRTTEPSYRDKSWIWIRERYRRLYPDWQVIEGKGSEKRWQKGKAIDDALAQATGDVLIIADADCIVPEQALREAAEKIRAGAPWVMPHTLVHRLSERSSMRALETTTDWPTLTGERGELARHPYRGFPGGGVLVVPRADWEATGGIPKDFVGWGAEDETAALILDTLIGPHERLEYDLIHLWHPPQPNKQGPLYRDNRSRFATYREAKGDPERMFELVCGNLKGRSGSLDWLHRTHAARGQAMRDTAKGAATVAAPVVRTEKRAPEKVTVRYRDGRVREVSQRDARVLVAVKRAEVVSGEPAAGTPATRKTAKRVKSGTYLTRDMQAKE